jgi:hypothetical protein
MHTKLYITDERWRVRLHPARESGATTCRARVEVAAPVVCLDRGVQHSNSQKIFFTSGCHTAASSSYAEHTLSDMEKKIIIHTAVIGMPPVRVSRTNSLFGMNGHGQCHHMNPRYEHAHIAIIKKSEFKRPMKDKQTNY